MKKKVLILTASPVRDKLIDGVIADELRSLGCDVKIKACLREGRDAVMAYKPNVIVVPPIRNPYSRDFVEVCRDWGCGVVSRHTEPSCDWDDFKKGTEKIKQGVLGLWKYDIDKELIWGDDEAQILNRRGSGFPAIAVGAIGLDIYKHKKLLKGLVSPKEFNEKHKLDPAKKTIIISSPWGFADSAPDLSIDDITLASKDFEGQGKHMAMTEQMVQAIGKEWNIIVTVHPGVGVAPYEALSNKLGVDFDSETPMMELMLHCDALIHAGSTAGISAHILNIPSFQYGDVNCKESDSWWGLPESTISKVAPYFNDTEKLIEAVRNCKPESNASKVAIKKLETGRYGKMDGNAYRRAAKEIFEVDGKFKYRWPRAHVDYDTPNIIKEQEKILTKGMCGICENTFYIVNDSYMHSLCNMVGGDIKKIGVLSNTFCPHCAARFFKK